MGKLKGFKKKVTQSALAKRIEDFAGVESTSKKPSAFNKESRKEYRPIMAPMLNMVRDVFGLHKLALAENRRAKLKEGEYGVDLKYGNISLPISEYEEEEKKLATIHAVSHLSITPTEDSLTSKEKEMLNENRELSNLLEDIRVNRYICLKYQGMLRYMPKIKQEMLVDLVTGDLVDLGFDVEAYKENVLTMLLYKHREEIRNNESYGDVLRSAQKINNELKDLMSGMSCGGEGEDGTPKSDDDGTMKRDDMSEEELDKLADDMVKAMEEGRYGEGKGKPMELSDRDMEKLREKLKDRMKDNEEAMKGMAKAMEEAMKKEGYSPEPCGTGDDGKYKELSSEMTAGGSYRDTSRYDDGGRSEYGKEPSLTDALESALGDFKKKLDTDMSAMGETVKKAMESTLKKIGEARATEEYGKSGLTEERIKEMTPSLDDIDDDEVKGYVIEKLKEMITKRSLKEVLEESMDEDATDEAKRKARVIFGEGKVGKFEKTDEINKLSHVKVVKKDSSFFTTSRSMNIRARALSKSLIRFLQKPEHTFKKTRDGRLSKIDPVRMKSDGKIFHRKITQKKTPHFHFVMDCSGSMSSYSLEWQSTMVKTISRLLREARIKYTIYCHSGTGKEFWYAEMQDKDLDYIRSHHYNLDGTMLHTLFEDHIKSDDKNVVFYLSDGGLPAEYSFIEGGLIMRMNAKARRNNVPIIGIGLNTEQVKVFDEWFVIKKAEDLKDGIKKMSNIITRTVGR